MAEPIRSDEIQALLARLEKAAAGGPAGFTSREAARALGVTVATARLHIQSWFARGLVKLGGTRPEKNIAGRSFASPVYQLVHAAAPPAARKRR